MRPIICYLEKSELDENKITISKEELELLCDKYYNAGYNDGTNYGSLFAHAMPKYTLTANKEYLNIK